ncbi:MAG: response regulator [Scytonema sp. PMC 1069.18]|nr:response regulator [Scytonema sp. PMC 1069.18]MEC4881552.1 response regulator [Scytonema sp. PMC 1070.18]
MTLLKISGENLWVDESYARMYVDVKVGSYIVITIADTGTGISSTIIDRIFDPFFTTKEPGKGTGLGLSTAIGIIKSHGGFISVDSKAGKGSTFKVYLPSICANESQGIIRAELPHGNGELILVVDDEVTICEITRTTLENHNYRVLTANDGIKAVALYAQHKDDINLVLIDLMMLKMDGTTTILTLQRINPEVQFIVMSGLVPNWTCDRNPYLNIQKLLPKPFTAQALLSTIQEVFAQQL